MRSLVALNRPPGILRTPTRQYTRGRRLSCPSPRTPRENCAYVPARTQTHEQRPEACVMGASPVLAPHGRPAPPAPAARPSHYQSQPLVYSRRDARAAAHLTSTPAPFCALCRLGTLPLASHKRLYQDAPRVRRRSGTAQARTRARTPARARARFHSLLHQTASLHTQHTAPCARIRLTMQPALHNNSLPHASPRHPALTPPAARSEKLQRAPLHACSLSAL